MTPQAGSQAPKKALLKGLLCCLLIALGLTSTHAKAYLETNDLLPKNRVWENFSPSPETSWGNELQSKELQGKNSLQVQKLASGVSLWTQRDPIGERGGVNLYGFVGNNSLSFWDMLGLGPSTLACSLDVCCLTNLSRMTKFANEVKTRVKESLTKEYLKLAIEIAPNPHPDYDNYRQSWNNHIQEIQNKIGSVNNCMKKLIIQYKQNKCRGMNKDRLKEQNLKLLALRPEFDKIKLPSLLPDNQNRPPNWRPVQHVNMPVDPLIDGFNQPGFLSPFGEVALGTLNTTLGIGVVGTGVGAGTYYASPVVVPTVTVIGRGAATKRSTNVLDQLRRAKKAVPAN